MLDVTATKPNGYETEAVTTEAIEHSEGIIARTIEEQTAKLPSDIFLWGALGSLAVSFAAGSGHSGHGNGLGKPLPPGWEPAMHDPMFRTFTLFEKTEFRTGDATDAAVFDAQGWIGGDYQRFWWKAEGEQETKGAKAGEFEAQALYSRLFSPFWDFQTGVRVDRQYSGRTRDTTAFFVVGLEGLARYCEISKQSSPH